MKRLDATLRERLFGRLVPCPDPGCECLLWPGYLTPQGYGQIGVGRKVIRVHRVAWELVNGPIPPGLVLDHVKARGCAHLGSRPFAFYDLVCICRREPGYQPFGGNGAYLRSLGLLEQDGQPHEVVRDVVVSAVTGNDLNLALGSPLPGVTS